MDKLSIITIDTVQTSGRCDDLLIFGQVAQAIFQKYGQVVLLCVGGSPH